MDPDYQEKRYIVSPDTMARYHFDWKEIRDLPLHLHSYVVLYAIPVGPDIT